MSERSQTSKQRRRGVILSSQGWQRLQAAEHLAAIRDNATKPYTLEQLSERVSLSPNTLTKVRRRQKPVDLQTLESYFRSFHLTLSSEDYISQDEEAARTALTSLQQTPLKGQLPLNSPFYIYRPPIEQLCAAEILKPGALIRIKGPRQYGKTSLMAHILNAARDRNFRSIVINLQSADRQILSDAERFLKWLCVLAAKDLGLPNELSQRWDTLFGNSYACSDYFETYLLPADERPLLLVLEELDELFGFPELAVDLFGMLRSWYEQGRYGLEQRNIWQRLRPIVIHSTEVWLPLSLHQSPFNVGLSIELSGFSLTQVQELTARYGLDRPDVVAAEIFELTNGHPYLTQLCLFHLSQQTITLDLLEKEALAFDGIFSSYLRRQIELLRQQSGLLEDLQTVACNPDGVELPYISALRLEGMGAVQFRDRLAIPSCKLYQLYFSKLRDF